MKFLDWYVKIAVGAALIGGSMDFFMIKTGFCSCKLCAAVLESEKRAFENSPEAQAMRDALILGEIVIQKKQKKIPNLLSSILSLSLSLETLTSELK